VLLVASQSVAAEVKVDGRFDALRETYRPLPGALAHRDLTLEFNLISAEFKFAAMSDLATTCATKT
jgi:hypothetical protein